MIKNCRNIFVFLLLLNGQQIFTGNVVGGDSEEYDSPVDESSDRYKAIKRAMHQLCRFLSMDITLNLAQLYSNIETLYPQDEDPHPILKILSANDVKALVLNASVAYVTIKNEKCPPKKLTPERFVKILASELTPSIEEA